MSLTDNVALSLGPLLAGCCIDALLQGILFVQFGTYFQHYSDDLLFLKLAVAGLVLLTTLKSCQSFVMLWVEFMDAYGDLDLAFTTFVTHWSVRMNPESVAALGSYVRVYFCYRLHIISKAWWTVALVASTDVAALSVISAAAYLRTFKGYQIENVLKYFHFSFVFVGDLLLTLLTAYFLTRYKKEILPRSHGTINVLIRLTFETAAASAVCALVSLAVCLVYFPLLAVSNEILPKLYAVSMMWTLNARVELRSLPWGNRSTLSYITSRNKSSLATKGPIRARPFELRRLSRTQQEAHATFAPPFDMCSTDSYQSQDPGLGVEALII